MVASSQKLSQPISETLGPRAVEAVLDSTVIKLVTVYVRSFMKGPASTALVDFDSQTASSTDMKVW